MVLLVAVSFVRLIDVLAERQGGVVTVNVIRAGRVSTIPPPIAPLRSPKFKLPLAYFYRMKTLLIFLFEPKISKNI